MAVLDDKDKLPPTTVTSGKATSVNSGAGSSSTGSSSASTAKPNPLGNFSSAVYSAAFYMVTPEAMNEFANKGTLPKGQDTGVYVIAQSGGINNKMEDRLITTDGTLGKGKEGLDHFIDDIFIETVLPGGPTGAKVGTNITFKVYEPYGISFVKKLYAAAAKLREQSPIMQKSTIDINAMSQHYVLGIKFYGYDINGKVVSADSPEVAGYDNGGGDGDRNAVIQRFFPIVVSDMKFKLDGKMTAYNFTGLILGEKVGQANIFGSIKENFTIGGKTVFDVLTGGKDKSSKSLAEALGESAEGQVDKKYIDIPSKISFEFLDADGKVNESSDIAKANLLSEKEFTASMSNSDQSKTADKINIADSFNAVGFIPGKTSISVKAGSKITEVIQSIITRSQYVSEALNTMTTPDAETKMVENTPTKPLKWFAINPVVTPSTPDPKTNNWTYDIKYQIKPYDIVTVRSPYVGKPTKYKGPYKNYEYWLTGKNTEILSYEMQFDNLYFVPLLTATNASTAANGETGAAPKSPQTSVAGDNAGQGINKSGLINDSVAAQLYSPTDQATAKIKILGDPDFLMSQQGISLSASIGGAINPFDGQVLIEIAFKTANDYSDNGTMVTEDIQFYQSSAPKNAGITGMVYRVWQVENTLSKGVFTQMLHCVIVDEKTLITESSTSTSTSKTSGLDASGRQTAATDPRVTR